ncbi:4'-phosphopantetheinyl transferase family protein [Candidiatus Paracoxiella cheracis]|uniref:4'-phosphopantetheinyl transferase family protein n=1 Tax=Candidiatus Paracoxiella cheracis TaxID=3405120 RepID=UPI003BF4F295
MEYSKKLSKYTKLPIDFNVVNSLKRNEIHIWIIGIEHNKKDLQGLWQLLSSDETIRAQRFHFSRDRNMYVIAHGALRKILSCYLYQLPEAIQISYTEKNKPYIDGSNIKFNLSHSHKLAVIVVGLTTPLGIDVEYLGNENLEELPIAKRFFSEEEYYQLIALPSEQQHHAFLETWTRKEAFIKAVGDGLNFPLQEFVVNVPPMPAAVKFLKPHRLESDTWYLQALNVPEDYVGTVAAANCNPTIVYYCY